jgi:hypothetical protein
MEIQCGFDARLAVTQSGELFAVAEQKLDPETRPYNSTSSRPSKARSAEASTM